MEVEKYLEFDSLKLYKKYRFSKEYINAKLSRIDHELIYIGYKTEMGVFYEIFFIYKEKNSNIHFPELIKNNLNPEQIVKDLNLETIRKGKHSYIKGYKLLMRCSTFHIVENNLKDKLNNIINR